MFYSTKMAGFTPQQAQNREKRSTTNYNRIEKPCLNKAFQFCVLFQSQSSKNGRQAIVSLSMVV